MNEHRKHNPGYCGGPAAPLNEKEDSPVEFDDSQQEREFNRTHRKLNEFLTLKTRATGVAPGLPETLKEDEMDKRPFPDCTESCKLFEIFGVSECESICKDKFDDNGFPVEQDKPKLKYCKVHNEPYLYGCHRCHNDGIGA